MKSNTSFILHPLLETLIFTWGIMLAGGIGFGVALRSAPTVALPETTAPPPPASTGKNLLQSDQDFPPRPGWNVEEEATMDFGETGEGFNETDENPDGSRYNSLQMQ